MSEQARHISASVCTRVRISLSFKLNRSSYESAGVLMHLCFNKNPSINGFFHSGHGRRHVVLVEIDSKGGCHKHDSSNRTHKLTVVTWETRGEIVYVELQIGLPARERCSNGKRQSNLHKQWIMSKLLDAQIIMYACHAYHGLHITHKAHARDSISYRWHWMT